MFTERLIEIGLQSLRLFPQGDFYVYMTIKVYGDACEYYAAPRSGLLTPVQYQLGCHLSLKRRYDIAL